MKSLESLTQLLLNGASLNKRDPFKEFTGAAFASRSVFGEGALGPLDKVPTHQIRSHGPAIKESVHLCVNYWAVS